MISLPGFEREEFELPTGRIPIRNSESESVKTFFALSRPILLSGPIKQTQCRKVRWVCRKKPSHSAGGAWGRKLELSNH